MVKGLGAGHGKPPVLVLEGLVQKLWSGDSQEGRDRWAETWKPGRKASRRENTAEIRSWGGSQDGGEGRELSESHVEDAERGEVGGGR